MGSVSGEGMWSVVHPIQPKMDSIKFTMSCNTIISYILTLLSCSMINPRRMRESYGSHFVCLSVCMCVCLSVCVSVTELTTTCLVYTLKVGCH